MPLLPGARVGPYEVIAKLGEGGMGQVYRARDTQLDRDVALKILPPLLAADPERLARFEREAKTLAALNHPNIAHIYGVEKNALVMELVPGRTLEEIIAPAGHSEAERVSARLSDSDSAARHGDGAPRNLNIDEAIHIALQIALGLEAAHEAGIVHRDLKPANIKQRDDGVVKLLDFGLARAMDSATATSGSSAETIASPTMLSPAMTQQGIILGTAGYMSPEQARGRVADKRADIWAFGVVLYEMLTGKRLFAGETVTEVIATVIKEAPNLDALPADTPPRVRALLARCLDRDVKTRLRDIGEARVMLLRANDPQDGSMAHGSAGPHATGIARREIAAWSIAGIAIAATAVLLFAGAGLPASTDAGLHVVRTMIPPPADAAFDADVTVAPAVISPDGRLICFGARSQNGKIQLWLRALDSADAKAIDGTDGASFPFWSPDSKSIGFYVSGRGRIERVDVAGGAPFAVVRASFVRGASWGINDTILYDSGGRIHAVPSTGGEPRDVTSGGTPRSPWMLPDGRHLLYVQRDANQIHVVALDGTGDAIVTNATSNAVYANGYLLYMREDALLAQPFGLEKLAVSGAPIALAKGVQQINGESRGVFSASETGLLLYQDGGAAAATSLEWFDGTGKRTSSLGELGRARGVSLSPDDRFVLTLISDADGGSSLVRINLSNAERNRLAVASPGDDISSFTAWSPDGRFVAYATRRGGKVSLARVDAGGGQEQKIVDLTSANGLPSDMTTPRLTVWARDAVFYAGNVTGGAWRLPLAPSLAAAGPPTRVLAGDQGLNLRLSPDSRWLAFQAQSQSNTAVSAVFVQSYPAADERQQVADRASLPRWSDDGRSLYFAVDNQLMVASATETGGSLHFGTPREIMPVITGRGYSYDVTKDGRILALVTSDKRAMRPLTLVQNWLSGQPR
jgi:eukaryotic-like serine/threonine-protein kinase